MKKILLILSILLVGIPFVKAGNRTELQMKESAARALRGYTTRSVRNSELKELFSLPTLKIYGYDEGGFAVITTDDTFDAVIGYSATKYSGEMPCGFKWWLETANEVMENVKSQVSAKSRVRLASRSAGVGPLMTTKWGQDRPFNNKCKLTVNGHVYSLFTGCAATAMAQIMNYYKHPVKGKGEYSYSLNYTDWGKQAFAANFENSYYDWDNMLDDYSEYQETDLEDKYTEAVSKLMSDCGISVTTVYTTIGSTAYTILVPSAMKDYFSYSFFDKKREIYSRKYYSDDEWISLIYDALDNNHPILYRGDNNGKNAHFFVIHGYEPDGKVTVNWGWNGRYDGSFMIGLLSCEGKSYNDNQQMIIPVPEGKGTTAFFEEKINDAFDIYDTNGRLVKKQTTTTESLKKGIYIINKQKTIIK